MNVFGWTGEKENGKSYLLAKTLYKNLRKNLALAKSGLPPRQSMVLRTLGLRPAFYEQWGDWIHYFDDFDELPAFTGCDVYLDDITLRLSARNWDMLKADVQDWLTGSSRLSCNVYFTAVTFKRVVIDFRENTDYVAVVTKGMGSPRPMIGYPPVKRIWGIINEQSVSPADFRSDMFNESEHTGGKMHFIRKKYLNVYDHQNLSLREGYPDLEPQVRWCRSEECPEYIANGGPHMKLKHV